MSNGLGAETYGSLSTGVPVDVFLHIPKTAGVSVRWALRRQYRETGYLHLALPDPSEVSPSPIADTISLEGAKRRLADSRSEPFGVVFGHMPFGIHEALTRPVRYFTMVRNPVERVVSQYYFVTTRQHALHRAV